MKFEKKNRFQKEYYNLHFEWIERLVFMEEADEIVMREPEKHGDHFIALYKDM